MLIRWWLRILEVVIQEFDLVTSEANQANALTKVRKAWLKVPIDAGNGYVMYNIEDEHVKMLFLLER